MNHNISFFQLTFLEVSRTNVTDFNFYFTVVSFLSTPETIPAINPFIIKSLPSCSGLSESGSCRLRCRFCCFVRTGTSDGFCRCTRRSARRRRRSRR